MYPLLYANCNSFRSLETIPIEETELLTVPPVPHFHLCMSLINTTRLQDPLLLCHQRLNVLLLFPVLSNITNERKTPYNTVQAVFFGKILQVRQ